ncbi:MAG: iron chelate uptake ABC transporter family permease subunit, partial [Proteobacteria bacterium]|nr:iron chelate uptake ABC transporter family permease subunit [Pseudomonadota bacterium]
MSKNESKRCLERKISKRCPERCHLRFLFIIASVLTGFSVSVAGIIGFVGLVIPHFMRMLVGRDHRI